MTSRQLSLDALELGSGQVEVGVYRYLLWRKWQRGPQCLFIMLNPSTADATRDDRTVRRCQWFARTWNYSGIEVANLFGLRSTNPKALYEHAEPVGPENDEHIRLAARRCDRVVCAWGNHGRLHNRGHRVLVGLVDMGVQLWCFRLTKPGHPEHPLYQRSDSELVRLWGRP